MTLPTIQSVTKTKDRNKCWTHIHSPVLGQGTAARDYASVSHFFMKLDFAAPASGLPFLSIAFGSQASFVHFVTKLLNAAPASGLPSLPRALV